MTVLQAYNLHMTVEQQIVQKLRTLSPERQQQVLALVEKIEKAEGSETEQPKRPLRSLRGLWKDLNVNISEEDIAEARREMWGNFPRPFPE
jgi:hypothetical protein